MGVEEVGVGQGDLQQRLDDVADSAVVRQADLLRSADEVPQAEQTGWRQGSSLNTDRFQLLVSGLHQSKGLYTGSRSKSALLTLIIMASRHCGQYTTVK